MSNSNNNMLNHPVLPLLKHIRTIAGFAEEGVWDARHATELANLSQDIKVEKVGIDINSIPDIWARPLLFEMALFDVPASDGSYEGHLLHKRVLGEWRGLIAMLALKEAGHIQDLTALSITVPMDAAAKNSAPAFLRAAANLIPTGTIDAETSWHQLYIFLYKNRPIGMTSPTTLVVTSTDYFNSIDQNIVPWFNGKLLLDPTKKIVDDTIGELRNRVASGEFISAEQRSLLAGWLKKLNDGLHERGAASRANALLVLINSYITDLGFTLPTTPDIELDSNASLGLTSGIFSVIDLPARAPEYPPSHSAVRLEHSRIKPLEPAKPILVVDKLIARQWQMDEAQIAVWKGKTLRTAIPQIGFPDSPPREKNTLGEIHVTDAEVWAPKWFFKPHLYVVGRETAFDNVAGINLTTGSLKYNEQSVTPILPLDQVLIDYLTVEDLASRISFKQEDEGIRVTLRLTLSSPDQNGKSFTVSQLYRRNEGQIRLLEGVPVLEVWPDFKTTSWKAYYTYYDRSTTTETFEARPYFPGFVPNEIGHISDKVRVTKSEQYPEAVICTVSGVADNIGFLLIKQPPELTPQDGIEYRVGVDFGATGTNIYFRVGGQNPQPFELKERYVSITNHSERNVIYDNCLPAASEKTPFLSIFKKFPNVPAQNYRPLLDSIIYFPRTLKSGDQNITYNLKWSDNQADTHKVEAFLKQIALQVAAEAVNAGSNRIKWNYSFPTAFGPTRRGNFAQAWAGVTQDCKRLTGVNSVPERAIDETESVAAAKYFCDPAGHHAPTNMGAVFIDIGGSTSDIAIWQHGLVWQTSILLAGREIFLDFLHDNLSLLKTIKSDIDLKPIEAAKEISQSAFYAQVDHLLRREGENLLGRLHHAGTESRKMQQVVALGLSGLFFYVGLVLNHYRKQKKYQNEVPSFYIGGNGSQILRWLTSGGPFTRQAPANKVFSKAFFKGSGFEGDLLNIEISRRPKAEAAFGLICDTSINHTHNANDKVILAGERFKQGHKEMSWDTVLDRDEMPDAMTVPEKLEKLEEFIIAYNEGARDAELLPVATNANQRVALLRAVRSSLGQTIANGEPVFILALKSLLKILRGVEY
jgi:hypothetical protein